METLAQKSSKAKKLSTILATAFFSLSVVVLLLYGGVKTYHTVKIQQALISNMQQLIAQDAAKTVSSFINENFSTLETASGLTDLYALSEVERRQFLQGILGLRRALRQVVLLNTRNQVLAQSSRLSMEAPSRLMDQVKYIEPGQEPQKQRAIGPVYIDSATSEPIVSIAVPVTDVFGDSKGTLIAELNLKSMWDIVDHLKVGETGYVYVCDREGNLLACHDTARVLRGENVSHLKAVADFIHNQPSFQPDTATSYQGIMGLTVVGTYAPLKSPDWAVISELPWKEAYREITLNVATAIGITLVMACFAGIFGTFIAKRLAVPVIDLTETASRIAAGERDLQAEVVGPMEVARLAMAFNSMTAQLRQSLTDLEQRFADLKRTEEALRLSEERLRLALEGTYDGIWDWDVQSGQAYFSSRYYTMMGYEPNEFPATYENWRQRIHPDDLEPSERAVQRAVEQHTWFAIEFRFKARNGEWRWILSRAKVAESDPSGKAVRVAGSHTDITERKRVEEALRESQQMLQSVLDTIPARVFWKDLDSNYLGCNSPFALDAGLQSPEEIVGRNDFEMGWAEQAALYLSDDRLVLETGIAKLGYEEPQTTPSGDRIWLRTSKVPLFDVKGKIKGVLGTYEDITVYKLAEEALRKYERIVSTTQDLMALINRDYVYEAVNDSYLAAHQQPRVDVVGRPVSDVMGESVFKEKLKDRIDQALSGQAVHFQETFDFAGLGRRIVDVNYFPILDANGKVEGVVLNARDITETRKLEEQLMQSQKIESIGTLAGGVAHEINNPINGIMNYAQLILDRLETDDPASGFAQEILRETRRIAKIVRNLLTFARHEKQSHSPAQLADIVSAVLSLIQTVMRHDQIALELTIPEDLPKIKCRSQQIQQVLMNLMTNARDALNERYPGYSPEKTLRIASEVIIKQGRRFIRTTVEDTGPGIPADIRDRIFDPFFTTKPKETGTGLGLSISYGIVKDHKGELSVESEPDHYTRFHMDLPVDNGWTLGEN